MQQNHHIQTATFDLSIKRIAGDHNSNRAAIALQERLLNQLQNKAIPRLETVFDQFCNGVDDIITIDELNVDLTATSIAELESSFSDLLEKAVEKSISELPLDIRRKENQHHSIRHVFLHFIKTGRLTWNANVNSVNELEEAIKDNVEAITGLKTLLTSGEIRKRIATQFTDSFFEQIVRQYGAAPEVLLKFFNEVNKVLKKRHTILLELMKDWILIQLESDKVLLEKKMQPILNSIKVIDGKPESPDWFKKNVLQNQKDKGETFARESELDNEQALFLSYTGLVLVAPFIKSLFEELELLENNDFKTESDREKAVHLLYYMCTARTEPEEIDTTFFKLICGIKMHSPIRKNVVLSDREKTEVNTCLQAAINHWKVLKSTSPEGLQEGFLQRAGKIIEKEDHWKLTVESKTIDILLKDIPWSFSVVKLPWMSKMIFVDWVT